MKRILASLALLLLLVPSVAFAAEDIRLIKDPIVRPIMTPAPIRAPLLEMPDVKEPVARIGKAKEFFDLSNSDIDPEQLVAIAIRGWCSAGHGIHIEGIEMVNGEMVVRYNTSDPDPNLVYPAVMVYVYHATPLNVAAKPSTPRVAPPILPIRPLPIIMPVIIKGEIYVTARTFAEGYGYSVAWDAEDRTVRIGDITVKIDSDIAYVNDKPVQMPAEAKIVNGRTMLPLRFLTSELAWPKQ